MTCSCSAAHRHTLHHRRLQEQRPALSHGQLSHGALRLTTELYVGWNHSVPLVPRYLHVLPTSSPFAWGPQLTTVPVYRMGLFMCTAGPALPVPFVCD